MEKIFLKSLQLAGFERPAEIAKIISYTPNPTAALEMILGVFEPRVINDDTCFVTSRYDDMAKIVEADELGAKVKYIRFVRKTKRVYFITEDDRINKRSTDEKPEKYYTADTVTVPGYSEEKSENKMVDFYNTYNIVLSKDEFYEKLKNIFGS